MALKVASGLAFLLFAAAVLVQYNDPDALFWMLIYGSIAALSLAAFFDRYYPRITAALALVYLIAVFWFLPNFLNTSLEAFSSVRMKNVEHELVRETWGLLICFVWTLVL
jgi:hypothetical protein